MEEIRIRTVSAGRYGRPRHGIARMKDDGWWHVTFCDEPDLTFLVSRRDMEKYYVKEMIDDEGDMGRADAHMGDRNRTDAGH